MKSSTYDRNTLRSIHPSDVGSQALTEGILSSGKTHQTGCTAGPVPSSSDTSPKGLSRKLHRGRGRTRLMLPMCKMILLIMAAQLCSAGKSKAPENGEKGVRGMGEMLLQKLKRSATKSGPSCAPQPSKLKLAAREKFNQAKQPVKGGPDGKKQFRKEVDKLMKGFKQRGRMEVPRDLNLKDRPFLQLMYGQKRSYYACVITGIDDESGDVADKKFYFKMMGNFALLDGDLKSLPAFKQNNVEQFKRILDEKLQNGATLDDFKVEATATVSRKAVNPTTRDTTIQYRKDRLEEDKKRLEKQYHEKIKEARVQDVKNTVQTDDEGLKERLAEARTLLADRIQKRGAKSDVSPEVQRARVKATNAATIEVGKDVVTDEILLAQAFGKFYHEQERSILLNHQKRQFRRPDSAYKQFYQEKSTMLRNLFRYAKMKKCERISFNNCYMDSGLLRVVIEHFTSNDVPTITHLELEKNNITAVDGTITPFVEMLKSNTTLRVLSLRENDFASQACYGHFVKALNENKESHLTTLSLDYTERFTHNEVVKFDDGNWTTMNKMLTRNKENVKREKDDQLAALLEDLGLPEPKEYKRYFRKKIDFACCKASTVRKFTTWCRKKLDEKYSYEYLSKFVGKDNACISPEELENFLTANAES